MKHMYVMGTLMLISLTAGCATGLNAVQKSEYQAMKANQVLIEEKDPSVGAALGILPGGGSFYAREPGLGIANLLLWPVSILWDPVSGYQGSMMVNYEVTTQDLKVKRDKDIAELDERLRVGDIETSGYLLERRNIDQRYTFE